MKNGAGRLVLSGDGIYSGPTTVNAGALEVRGNMADGNEAGAVVAGSQITVKSGATFTYGGSGAAVSGLTLENGSTFEVAVSGSTPSLQVADALALGGGTLKVTATATVSGSSPITIIANSGSFSGQFAGLPEGATVTAQPSGQLFKVSYGDGMTGADVTLTPQAAPPTTPVTRLSGPDRIDTAIAIAQNSYPGTDSAQAAVLARSDEFPDALAGTPLAKAKSGPLLINPTNVLDSRVLAEINRVLAPGATVYVLGGTAAITQTVADAITAAGYTVSRISGPERYATAVAIAQALGSPQPLLLATGTDFADALSAGSAAAKVGGAVLLTNGDVMPASTAAYLSARSGVTLFALGGPASRAAGNTASPVVGVDRFETSVKAAQQFFSSPTVLGVASGLAFPDALTGGAHIAKLGGPLVLTRPEALPASVNTYVVANAGTLTNAYVYGGTAAVSAAVVTTLTSII
ncbi:MAG: cell wall-binding repeat-containing protein [Acidimicrobiales bacterium]|nr:cell wall-binding repeat-containing protein [Acidimicrobiales bacterium]